jgi:hypothetical protein
MLVTVLGLFFGYEVDPNRWTDFGVEYGWVAARETLHRSRAAACVSSPIEFRLVFHFESGDNS